MTSKFPSLTNEVREKLKLIYEKVGSEVRLSKDKFSFKADAKIELNDEIIFIEVEEAQTHPDTNVSKYWMYLQENPDKKIKLIQIFGRAFIETVNNYASRKKLSEFIAKKIKGSFSENFEYVPINLRDFNYSKEDYKNNIGEIVNKVIELIREHIK